MKREPKQRPGDERLVYDESADSVERASALLRLASDGRKDLASVARSWLTHEDFMLRSEGISMLVGFWREEGEIDTAIRLLHEDPETDVRSMAAMALSNYLERTQNRRDDILRALEQQMESEPDDIVQNVIRKLLRKLRAQVQREP